MFQERILIFSEIVGELQLKKYGEFMKEYGAQLKDIEDALGESVNDSWDMTLDPISLEVQFLFLEPLSTENNFMHAKIAYFLPGFPKEKTGY